MRLHLHRLIALATVALGTLSLSSCDDTLSEIGESVLPARDQLKSNRYELQFSATTVAANRVYSANTTAGLVGAISDPEYGDFSADFIAQMRTAPGFKFTHTPVDGKIDSVRLRLVYTKQIGVTTAPMLISVYEAPRGFEGSEFSEQSLAQYATPSALLGRKSLTLAGNTQRIYTSSTDTTQYLQYLTLELDNSLGQRIYDLTQSTPSVFDTQASFSQGVLGGLYVTASTGSGAVIRVGSVEIGIYYSYLNDKNERVSAVENFINTKLTPHANGISNTHITSLLTPSDEYTYIKGPGGVQTEITLPASEMLRLLAGRGNVTIGKEFTLADTQFNVKVSNPTNLLLNPPTYMMLMPTDSVENYFRRGQTERTQAATSYLSTAYNVDEAQYNFYNVARMISTHLREHARYQGGQWTIDADLRMRILPVDRTATTSGTTTTTTSIDEYLFPSFVRLGKSSESLRLGVVTSEFVQ